MHSLDTLNMPRNNALHCPYEMHHLNIINLDLSECYICKYTLIKLF